MPVAGYESEQPADRQTDRQGSHAPWRAFWQLLLLKMMDQIRPLLFPNESVSVGSLKFCGTAPPYTKAAFASCSFKRSKELRSPEPVKRTRRQLGEEASFNCTLEANLSCVNPCP
ncbi:ras-related protein Rab-9A [Platysternon megacephalum]|uniref:Ras-related protein Rab-9A n=1 Tax=Platysternon megacephalum TaxID=55544 RepID=A0A4D9EJH9_9SAUR|nr:ras-related protein Rab-9A [Platysternon megacephalum]